MLGLALLAACSPASGHGTAQGHACEVRLPVAPAAGSLPAAVLRDVAGGPSEYLAGSPGGPLVRLAAATGFSPPQGGGSSLFFSVRHGASNYIYRGSLGGCAERIAEGTLGAVEHEGRALTALVGAHWEMLGDHGEKIIEIAGAAGAWTLDGRLVEPVVGGIEVYGIDGKKRSLPVTGASPQGPLGRGHELMATATGVQVLDLETGALVPLDLHGQPILRAPAGSPDGKHLAFIDASGAAQVLDVESGVLQPLAPTSLPTGFAWSRDSRWVAVQGVYGGVALDVQTGKRSDSGSLVVVSW